MQVFVKQRDDAILMSSVFLRSTSSAARVGNDVCGKTYLNIYAFRRVFLSAVKPSAAAGERFVSEPRPGSAEQPPSCWRRGCGSRAGGLQQPVPSSGGQRGRCGPRARLCRPSRTRSTESRRTGVLQCSGAGPEAAGQTPCFLNGHFPATALTWLTIFSRRVLTLP